MAIAAGTLALFWSVLIVTTASSPRVALDDWGTDHYSHVGAAVLFTLQGFDIYRNPIKRLCLAPNPEAVQALSAAGIDTTPCRRPEIPDSRPLAINWQNLPRGYPPGHVLYFLPEALLYRFTDLSFKTINAVTIVKFVLIAHLCWWLGFLALEGVLPRAFAWVLLSCLYLYTVVWSLAGFYDTVYVLALLAAVIALQKKRNLAAVLAASAACFLHFRALWSLPILGFAAWRAYRGRELWPEPRRSRRIAVALAGASGVLLGLTAYSFLLLWPMLRTRYPVHNPVHYSQWNWSYEPVFSYVLWTAGLAALLALYKQWLALATVLCISVFLVSSPQLFPWHAAGLFPLLFLTALDERDRTHAVTLLPLLLWGTLIGYEVFETQLCPAWLLKGGLARILGH
jgi:hypothetical protein